MDVGRTKDDIPKHLRDAIRLRDQTCRFPRCDTPSEYCDIDHVTPHRISGQTEPSGLQALCRTHHRAKTFDTYTQTTTSTHTLDTTWTGTLNITLTTTPPNQHRKDEN